MMGKRQLATALGLLLLGVAACSHVNGGGSSYSEAELRSAVLGRWDGTADLDGESVDFSLVLEQASARTKPGATTLSVAGTITSVNPALNGNVDGEVSAGQELNPAELSLRVEDGTQLGGVLEKQGLSDGHVSKSRQVGTFSLARP